MMKKFLTASLFSAAAALTLTFGAVPLNVHAAEAVPSAQAAVSAPVSVPAQADPAVSAPAAVSLQGKKLSILGDSISTFTGTITFSGTSP